jgi:hypothetical protein
MQVARAASWHSGEKARNTLERSSEGRLQISGRNFMSNLTAAILTFIVVSPSIIVLGVLIGRGIRDWWTFSFSRSRNIAPAEPCHILDQAPTHYGERT